MTSTFFTTAIRNTERLREVARLGLEKEIKRAYLQDTVDAVAERLGTPFAVADVLLDDAQVFLAGVGPMPGFIAEAGGTPLEWAFCQPLVTERAARQVPDLAADPMFRDNPLVTIGGVRAYVGAPLISHAGHVLGGLCALDVRPRPFSGDDLEFLRQMAKEVVDRIEEHAGQ